MADSEGSSPTDPLNLQTVGDLTSDEMPAAGLYRPPVGRSMAERQADAQRLLAVMLVVLLATVLGVVFLLLGFRRVTAADTQDLLSVVLAPLVGLVGAACGFYFGGKSESRGSEESKRQ